MEKDGPKIAMVKEHRASQCQRDRISIMVSCPSVFLDNPSIPKNHISTLTCQLSHITYSDMETGSDLAENIWIMNQR